VLLADGASDDTAMSLGPQAGDAKGSRTARVLLLIACSLAVFLLPVSGGAITGAAAAATPELYNVQVSVQTTSPLPDYFVISAYNSSGALLTTSQSQYPAGSLEVPAGSYFFTATAIVQSSYYQTYPVYPSGGAVSASSPSVCCVYKQPLVEYGFAVKDVSGPVSLTIPTRNVNATSATAITIQADYPNGTAAEGASVSASIVGNSYWWGYDSKVSMYNVTDAGGRATLVTPNAPILLSLWASLPVNLPMNQTTVQRTVAGEPVNVTVYWQPTYVSFAGWSLVTPPQTTAKVTLHYQQPMYYVTPYADAASSSGIGQVSPPTREGVVVPGSSGAQPASNGAGQAAVAYPGFGPGGISQPPAQAQFSTQTVYVSTGAGPTTSAPGPDNTLLLAAVGAAVALGVLSLLIVAVRSRNKQALGG
jgi:hypothetical protein